MQTKKIKPNLTEDQYYFLATRLYEQFDEEADYQATSGRDTSLLEAMLSIIIELEKAYAKVYPHTARSSNELINRKLKVLKELKAE